MKRKDINYFIMKHILRTFQPSRYGNKLHASFYDCSTCSSHPWSWGVFLFFDFFYMKLESFFPSKPYMKPRNKN